VADLTPQQRVEAECRRRGKRAVVDGCARLIRGDYADAGLITALAPDGSAKFFDGRKHDDTYWFRVWGARGLLWAWHDSATGALLAAFDDEAWRVREMAAKVVARHLVGDALPAVAKLRDDPVPRVRAAADRAVARLTANNA
jgi:hypothetical protein